MPHVVLKGPMKAEDIWLGFKPLEMREGGNVFKAVECFLSHDRQTLMVRCLVVERSFSKIFFAKIADREGSLTVGIETFGAPEKTDAVKRLLGLIAWQLMQAEPQLMVDKSNIAELVTAPK